MAARTLVLGYGNPGRQDDGLGPAAAEAVERLALPDVDVEVGYQLNIEDGADAARYERIIFLDAAAAGPEPFAVRAVSPAEAPRFSSHLLEPEAVLAIAQRYYGRAPAAWLVAIRGYAFELEEALTERARVNLEAALGYLRRVLTEGEPLECRT